MRRATSFPTRFTAFLTVVGMGCGGDLGAVDDEAVAGEQSVRISDRFTIDLPAGDAWASDLIDQDTARSGLQIQVEVHRLHQPGRVWVDRNHEPWQRYQVISTGHEDRRGVPRLVASSTPNQYHAIDGAFLLGGRLFLLGESTGGASGSGHRRNPKPAVVGIAFNGARSADRLRTSAVVVPVDDPVNGRMLVDVPSVEGFQSNTDQDPGRAGFQAYAWVDQVSFAQRWSTGEAFACYNFMTTGAERSDGRSTMLGGSTPDQYRAPEGAFALDGVGYAIGERSGGAHGAVAAAPHRALLHVQFNGRANGNDPVDSSINVVTLPR